MKLTSEEYLSLLYGLEDGGDLERLSTFSAIARKCPNLWVEWQRYKLDTEIAALRLKLVIQGLDHETEDEAVERRRAKYSWMREPSAPARGEPER